MKSKSHHLFSLYRPYPVPYRVVTILRRKTFDKTLPLQQYSLHRPVQPRPAPQLA